MEREEPVSLPTVAVPVPAPTKPPVFSVMAPTVPVPVSVAPLAIDMALEAVLPVTLSVPALMTVGAL